MQGRLTLVLCGKAEEDKKNVVRVKFDTLSSFRCSLGSWKVSPEDGLR